MTSFYYKSWVSAAILTLLAGVFIGCGAEHADSQAMKSQSEDEFYSAPEPRQDLVADGRAVDQATGQGYGVNGGGDFRSHGSGSSGGDWGSNPDESAEFAMSTAAPDFESDFPTTASPVISPAPTWAQPAQVRKSRSMAETVPKYRPRSYPVPRDIPLTGPMETTGVPSAPQQPVEAAESITMPAVAAARENSGFTEVNVFYGTDRQAEMVTKASTEPLKIGMAVTIGLLAIAVGFLVFNRLKFSLAFAGLAGILFLFLGQYQHALSTRTGISYGPQRGTLVRGMATVTVPNSHQRGMVERPSIVRLEFEEDENKHVVLAKATELDGHTFYKRMEQELYKSEEQNLLVFVHGFNVKFDAAVRRTAQIATDLSFHGVPVCYSWPSQGSLVGYTVDENNVNWTVPHLRDFLLELATRSRAKSINIIAHSMGNRAVTASLVDIGRQASKSKLPIFDQVVLAAPDVDADHFRNELAPRLADVANHVTLYASSDDQALVASKHLHGGYPRAGESGANLVVVPEIETIDVSGIDLSLLGHSYYGDSESILKDLYDVVRNGLPASKRSGLISQQLRETTYWMLRRPQLSVRSETPIR